MYHYIYTFWSIQFDAQPFVDIAQCRGDIDSRRWRHQASMALSVDAGVLFCISALLRVGDGGPVSDTTACENQ